jgi:hypothetical protein
MRIVVHEYVNGDRCAYETSNDGGVYLRDLDGKRQVGAGISAFVETACEDNERGYDRVLDALALLTNEVEKRKAAAVAASASKAAG